MCLNAHFVGGGGGMHYAAKHQSSYCIQLEMELVNYLLVHQSKCQCQNGGQYQSLDILNPMAKSHDFPFIGFHSNSNSDILPIKELQLPGDPKIRTPDGQF